MIMASFHSGVCTFIFVDNFVVGLNVCGTSRRMSFESIDTIQDSSMSDMHKSMIMSVYFLQNNLGYLHELVVYFMCPVILSFLSPREGSTHYNDSFDEISIPIVNSMGITILFFNCSMRISPCFKL